MTVTLKFRQVPDFPKYFTNFLDREIADIPIAQTLEVTRNSINAALSKYSAVASWDVDANTFHLGHIEIVFSNEESRTLFLLKYA